LKCFFFFSSRRRHTRLQGDWSSDVCSSDLGWALWAMVRKKLEGIVHLAGKDMVNRWQFGLKVAKAFGLDAKLIRKVGSSRFPDRSEERRVGKECRSRWWT